MAHMRGFSVCLGQGFAVDSQAGCRQVSFFARQSHKGRASGLGFRV